MLSVFSTIHCTRSTKTATTLYSATTVEQREARGQEHYNSTPSTRLPFNSSFCLLLSLISGSSVKTKDRLRIAIPKAVSEKVSLQDNFGQVNSS